MVKVILKPIDNDHKPVELAEGKTILGRGPLLGCSDKKVSRNHAVLEINSDGEIFLTPTHVNPCFYRTKSDASPKMMKKDKALRLEPGDVFSLLPLTFQYQIMLSSDDAAKDSSTEVEASKEDQAEEKSPSEIPQKTKEEAQPEDTTTSGTPAKEGPKTGLNENGKPDQEEDEIEIPDEDGEVEEEIDSPKPKRRPPTQSTRGRKRATPASATTVSNEDQPRKKRSLPNWLIKSASSQQDKSKGNNGDALQKEDRGKRRGRKSQSEAGSMSRSARQNRQTIQRISLEDFVVSEDDWNSEDSGDGSNTRGAGGRGSGGAPKRGRRRAAADNSSGSDWEVEHKSQGRAGRDAARDASSGSDWEATSNTRRSGRRGTRRRAAAGDSESGSDWETDRRKKTPVQKKPRGRRSRKKMEDDEDEDENEERGGTSDTGGGGGGAKDRTSQKKDEEEEDKDEEEEEEEKEKEKNKKKEKEKDAPAVSSKKDTQAAAGQRKACQFGRKCYRKNAAHLDNFSHPGDSDYESPGEEGGDGKSSPAKKSKDDKDNEDSSDQKPECPYGTDCYRKNAQHRKDFLHTKKVRPKREASQVAAKKAKKNKDGDDEDVPYDLTDDESNDDYKPNDSEEK